MSRVKGIERLIRELKKIPPEAEKELAREVEFTAKAIEKDAKLRAPVNKLKNGGNLRQSIRAEQYGSPLTWRISAYANYAPYMEFGTGGLVQVPSELKEVAIQYKGAGIREVNLRPQPFLYPALVSGRKRFLDRVKRLVDKLGK